MKNNSFSLWCTAATREIRFRPDRKSVTKELMNHLEDHRDALMEQGMDEAEASKTALEAMGRAEVLAPQLAAIHKPFWGYMIQVSQIALVVLLVLALLPLWDYATDLNLYDAPHVQSFEVYDPASYADSSVRVLHHLSEPDVSFSSEAGTFTVTDAAVFTTFSQDGESSCTQLYLLVRQTGLLPWKERAGYFHFYSATAYFSARDSLGNVYPSYLQTQQDGVSLLISESVQSGIFTGTHELWINDFPQDAQWVEILCTRDGRSYTLRIDLTGGDRT